MPKKRQRRTTLWAGCGWVMLALGLGWGGPAAPPAAGQGAPVITGEVRDAEGAPLPRAAVSVVGTARQVVTDGRGRFVLAGLPAGLHRLEASLAGYAPEVRDLVVSGAGTTEVTFALRPTPLVLPGLVVTGAATGGAALDLTRASSQLSGRALERKLGGSVAETLSGQPGMGVRYNGPGAAAPVVRGLTGDRVVVMQDGHRSADLGGTAEDHMVTIDPLSAQRIEVIRGPAALLYGNNALGGVVNVLTGDAPSHGLAGRELSAAMQLESASRGSTAQARAAVPLTGGWSVAARVSGRRAGDIRLGSAPGLDPRLANTWQRHGGGAVSVGYGSPSVVGGATVRYFGFGYGVPTPPGDDDVLDLEGRLVSATGRVELTLGGDPFTMVRLGGSVSDYAHDELEGGAVEMAFALRTRALDVQARQAAVGPLAEGAWGVSLVSRDYVAVGEDQLTAPARAWAVGGFTYQQLPLSDRLTIELGARADRHDMTSRDDPQFGPGTSRAFTALSGSLGTSISLGRGATAAVSVARSFRAPTVEELFSDAPHAGTASYEVGDPGLEPEIMRGVDGVVRVRSSRMVAEAAAYASRIDDFITFTARGDTLIDGVEWPVLAYTQHGAAMHGAEATLDWMASDAVVFGVHGDVVRGRLAGGDPIPFLPPARLGTSARWEPGPLSLGVGAVHALAQRRVRGDPDEPTDAYTLLELDAGLRFTRGTDTHSLTVRVANATDRYYRDAASRIKRFAPNPGRNIALLYRIHF